MNGVLIIIVDTIIDYGTHAKKCAATCTKKRINELILGVHIIS